MRFRDGRGGKRLLDYLDCLMAGCHVKALILKHCHMGVDGAQALASALRVNGTLRELELEDNFLRYDAAQALAGALSVNSTLLSLGHHDPPGLSAVHDAAVHVGENGADGMQEFHGGHACEHECSVHVARLLARRQVQALRRGDSEHSWQRRPAAEQVRINKVDDHDD
jgi:hypothetical protein